MDMAHEKNVVIVSYSIFSGHTAHANLAEARK